MNSSILTIAAIFSFAGIAGAQLKIARLHPLLDDLAKNVGGEHVKVVPLFPEGGDPHSFSSSSSALASMAECQLVLASEMGLERYLKIPSDNLPTGARLIDVSAKIGGALDADSTAPGVTYESLIRGNVAIIVAAFE